MSIDQTRPYMLASCVPLLENQPHCEFLQSMDRRELEALAREVDLFAQEDARLQRVCTLIDETNSWKNIILLAATSALKCGTGTGLLSLAYEKSEFAKITFNGAGGMYGWSKCQNEEVQRLNNINQNSLKRSLTVGAGVAIGVVLYSLAICNGEKIQERSDSVNIKHGLTIETNSNRYLRLLDKVRQIKDRLLNTRDEAEIKQLPIAQDYFTQRASIIVGKQEINMNIHVGDQIHV